MLAKAAIYSRYQNNRQLEFLDFVLGHYVEQGVDELDLAKLTPLLKLKYHAVADASSQLGSPREIHEMFVGFQKHLYRAVENA